MSLQDHLQPDEEILYRAHITRLAWRRSWRCWRCARRRGLRLVRVQNAAGALVALAAGALVGLVLAWKLLVLRSNEYMLTNHRVIRKTGILSQQSMDSQLDKINNIEHRQTLWGRLLNFGDVEIDTASETGMAVFQNISRPLEFKRAIVAAAEQYRARRTGLLPPCRRCGPSLRAERLRQLKALLDDGLISREEYEAKRQQLIQSCEARFLAACRGTIGR